MLLGYKGFCLYISALKQRTAFDMLYDDEVQMCVNSAREKTWQIDQKMSLYISIMYALLL